MMGEIVPDVHDRAGARHPDIPENEFAAMSLASKLGIDVPEIDLVPLEAIDGLPDGITRYGASAYAIRRFDRTNAGPVHIEDFAQVYGVYADNKYENASYRQILSVLANGSPSPTANWRRSPTKRLTV